MKLTVYRLNELSRSKPCTQWSPLLCVPVAVLLVTCAQTPSGRGSAEPDTTPEIQHEAAEVSELCDLNDLCGLSAYAKGETLPKHVLYVNSCCPQDGPPDGTLQHPFPDINTALEMVLQHGTIAVAAGEYAGPLLLDVPVGIIGAGSERTRLQSSGLSPTVTVDGVDGVSGAGTEFSGFALRGDGGLGLWVRDSCELTCKDLDVSYYSMGFEWSGFGIYVEDSVEIDLSDLRLSQNQAAGIVFSGSHGSITNLSLMENGQQENSAALGIKNGSTVSVGKKADSPWEAKAKGVTTGPLPDCVGDGGDIQASGGVGIHVSDSVAQIRCLLVSGNHGGGIVFVDSPPGDEGAQSGDTPPDTLPVNVVSGNLIAGTKDFGVRAYNSDLAVLDNVISSISIDSGDVGGPGGDCVAALNLDETKRSAWVIENDLSGCAQTGILISGRQEARVVDNRILAPGRGGIWIQKQVEAKEVRGNTIDGAQGPGIVISTGSIAQVFDNKVLSSIPLTGEEMGHGIVLSDLPTEDSVRLVGNTVALNEQAGLVLDQCSADSVLLGTEDPDEQKANVVAGNGKAGIAVLPSASGFTAEDLEAVVVFDSPELGPNGEEDKENDVLFTNNSEYWVSGLRPEGDLIFNCIPPECTE